MAIEAFKLYLRLFYILDNIVYFLASVTIYKLTILKTILLALAFIYTLVVFKHIALTWTSFFTFFTSGSHSRLVQHLLLKLPLIQGSLGSIFPPWHTILLKPDMGVILECHHPHLVHSLGQNWTLIFLRMSLQLLAVSPFPIFSFRLSFLSECYYPLQPRN